ncbi:DUF350 domain-containing protein [Fundidesulfovibrio soli]|uniref:DUF350 domain-containing protein n=1 Tax=Fundidesulfovibrio soli TaxID=2922716 RepID=UPI001FB03302|nr:DUF350 domain-containing protein [Fundidesulfovibrio soli]
MIHALASLVFLALAFAVFWLAHRLCADRIARAGDTSLEEQVCARNNAAVALRFASFALASALGLCGPLMAPSTGFLRDVGWFAFTGAVLLALLVAAFAMLDRLVLPGIDNTKAILDGNLSVGLTEAGGGLATGLILKAAFTGQGTVFSGVVFFLLGQLTLVLFLKLLERLSPYDDQAEIAQGNAALGLHLGSMLVCLGIILASAVSGDFSHWGEDLAAFGLAAVRGVALLLACSWLADKVFLTGTTLGEEIVRDRNLAAVIAEAGVKLGIALIIAATA